MGTLLEVQLHAPDGAPVDEILDGCFTLVDELETIFTSYDETSPLNRLNAEAGLGPVAAPAALVAILRDAQRLGVETGGSFDVTVGPLLALWRDAARDDRIPDAAVVEATRRRVDVGEIAFRDDGTVSLPRGMALNLGGIGKGWALDRVAERLRARGVERALLSFGGSSVLALGAPPGAESWKVLVRTREGLPVGVVSLRDQHLSVSEAFGEERTIAGQRFGHVVDPRTGWPVRAARLAAVVAERGDRAEAWSTALLVRTLADFENASLGPEIQALRTDADGVATFSSGFHGATAFRPPASR